MRYLCDHQSRSAEVEEGGPNRDVLAEMVRQANSRARILDISVGGDGLILANEVPRHAAGE